MDSPRPPKALLGAPHPRSRPPGPFSFSESLPRGTGSSPASDSHWRVSRGPSRSQCRTRGHSDRGLSHSRSLSISLPVSHKWSRPHTQGPSQPHTHTHTRSLPHTNVGTRTLCVSHTQSPPSLPLSHTHRHTHTYTRARTHGVLLARSVLHGWRAPHAQGPAHTHGVPLGLALKRSVSHVPAAGPAPGSQNRIPYAAVAAAAGRIPASEDAASAPLPLLGPARGPLPRGGREPPGCSVALPPPPQRPLKPRPRHVTRSRIATARAASGQGDRLRKGPAGGGASGPGGSGGWGGELRPGARLSGPTPPAGLDLGPAALANWTAVPRPRNLSGSPRDSIPERAPPGPLNAPHRFLCGPWPRTPGGASYSSHKEL